MHVWVHARAFPLLDISIVATLTHHIDSAVTTMVDLIVSDDWVTASSDLDPSKRVAYVTREATIMELH